MDKIRGEIKSYPYMPRARMVLSDSDIKNKMAESKIEAAIEIERMKHEDKMANLKLQEMLSEIGSCPSPYANLSYEDDKSHFLLLFVIDIATAIAVGVFLSLWMIIIARIVELYG